MRLNIKPDPYFRRDGFNIHTDHYINLSEAALGGPTRIKTLHGEANINIEPGTQDGQEKVFKDFVLNLLRILLINNRACPNCHQTKTKEEITI